MRAALALAAVLAAGCTPSDARFGDVRTTVADRTSLDAHWDGVTSQQAAEERVRELLAGPVGPDQAVQVALLHNPELQASLDELGIRNAELLEATLLPNPHAEGAAGFGHGSEPDLHGSLTISISDLVFLPLERARASAALETATFAAAGAVLDTAYDARIAFVDYLAQRALLDVERNALEAAFLSWDASRRLAEAGNTNDLDLAQARALYEEARLAVAERELSVADARERAQVAMGLWGELTGWRAVEGLPMPPEQRLDTADLERRAIERSLVLAELRALYETEARRSRVATATGWVPEIRAGAMAEREEGEWEYGPEIEVELPLFDQGQGEAAVAEARMRQIRHRYGARAIRVRSAARAARFRLEVARDRVRFYREELVPLRARITELTLEHYNGMFASVFRLIEAKRDELETARRYVMAVRDYWAARAAVEQLMAGRLAEAEMAGGAGGLAGTEAAGGGDEGGH